jgi:hypothetical protein
MGNMELAMWKYVLAWIPMVFMAMANGALRDGWYGTHLGALQAHSLPTLSDAAYQRIPSDMTSAVSPKRSHSDFARRGKVGPSSLL